MRLALVAFTLVTLLAGAAGAQEKNLTLLAAAHPKKGAEPVGAIVEVAKDEWLWAVWKANQRLDDVTIFRCTNGCGRGSSFLIAVKDLAYRQREILKPGRYRIAEYRTMHKLDGWEARVPILEKLD
jgi:hypothetical protein